MISFAVVVFRKDVGVTRERPAIELWILVGIESAKASWRNTTRLPRAIPLGYGLQICERQLSGTVV